MLYERTLHDIYSKNDLGKIFWDWRQFIREKCILQKFTGRIFLEPFIFKSIFAHFLQVCIFILPCFHRPCLTFSRIMSRQLLGFYGSTFARFHIRNSRRVSCSACVPSLFEICCQRNYNIHLVLFPWFNYFVFF